MRPIATMGPKESALQAIEVAGPLAIISDAVRATQRGSVAGVHAGGVIKQPNTPTIETFAIHGALKDARLRLAKYVSPPAPSSQNRVGIKKKTAIGLRNCRNK